MKDNKLFYGYVAVLFATLTGGMGYSTSLLFGIFLTPMIEGSGSDLVLYVPTVATTTGVILGLFTGKLVRRTSIGTMLFIGGLAAALECVLYATANGPALIFAGAIALGFSVAFGMYSPISLVVNEWFVKDRAKVNGTAIGSMSILGIVVLFVATQMFGMGYSRVYLIFAVVNAVFAVCSILFVKTPSQKGMLPYGYEELGGAVEDSETDVVRPGIMLRDALRTPAFWLVLVAGWLFAIWGEGVFSYLPTLLSTEMGTDVGLANTMSVVVQVGAFAGGFIAGNVADRFGNKAMTVFLGAIFALGFVVTTVVYPQSMSAALLVVASVLLGLGVASYGNITPLVCSECFGDRDFESISPIYAMASQAGSATCPILVGIAMGGGGGIRTFYLIGAAVSVVAIVLMLMGINMGPMRRSENASAVAAERV